MSESSLVNYRRLTDHYSSRYGTKIDRVVIHHCAGVLSVETLGNIFTGERQCSATYGVGSDGRIGQYVSEVYRPWTTSSYVIDRRAVTIEVSNCENGGDWKVSDLCLQKTIDLVTDICRRNGITNVTFTGNRDTSVLQMHRWWASTDCPGEYLASKFSYISQKVMEQLGGVTPTPTPEGEDMKVFFVPKTCACAVRSQANKNGTVLATIPVNAQGTVFGFNRAFSNDGYEWCRVKYGNAEGYCQMDTKAYWLVSE